MLFVWNVSVRCLLDALRQSFKCSVEAREIFARVEIGFNEMVEESLDGGRERVRGGGFVIATDGQVEEGKQLETALHHLVN